MTNQWLDLLVRYKKNRTCRTFIIAEAGVHHGCDMDIAKTLIGAAAEAGADAIKFQTYKSDTLVTPWAETYWKNHIHGVNKTQFEYFSLRDKFTFDDYHVLSQHAKDLDIIFCSTPFDLQSVSWLQDINVPFWKIASADIDNFPLLEAIAETKKPVILSTGASYFNEIRETIAFLLTRGVDSIALLHCNLAYPTLNEQANLRRITELQKLFPDCMIGYSDHTIPDVAVIIPVLAVTLGAKIIEKHFTLDRTLPEDDHYHSVDPILLKKMIQNIKIAEDATKLIEEITDSEIPARKHARRSIVAKTTIHKGTIITEEMIIPKRPGGGISPTFFQKLLGQKAKQTIQQDQQITWELIE